VLLFSGKKLSVNEKIVKDTVSTVYNFTVRNYHSYYVSELCILVHNTCPEKVVVKTSSSGKYTEPTLPKKTIVDRNGVKVEHYYKSGDHAPPHMHVKGEGNSTKIGANGKPIKGSPELSAAQKAVVGENKSIIRSAGKKINEYQKFQGYKMSQ
jgi:hypothetical protein